jgi:hypothetical protein
MSAHHPERTFRLVLPSVWPLARRVRFARDMGVENIFNSSLTIALRAAGKRRAAAGRTRPPVGIGARHSRDPVVRLGWVYTARVYSPKPPRADAMLELRD